MVDANVAILSQFIDTIKQFCKQRELKEYFIESPECFIRNRKMSFSSVTFMILSLLKKSLNIELRDFFESVPSGFAKSCTKSAFCQQRKKIKSSWFKFLLEYIATLFYE